MHVADAEHVLLECIRTMEEKKDGRGRPGKKKDSRALPLKPRETHALIEGATYVPVPTTRIKTLVSRTAGWISRISSPGNSWGGGETSPAGSRPVPPSIIGSVSPPEVDKGGRRCSTLDRREIT